MLYIDFLGDATGKEPACQCKEHKFNPWDGKVPWRRKWQPAPIFLSGKFNRQRSLAGCSPWGHRESDMTEHAHIYCIFFIHSSIDRHLGCFHVLAIINSASMNIEEMYVFSRTLEVRFYLNGNFLCECDPWRSISLPIISSDVISRSILKKMTEAGSRDRELRQVVRTGLLKTSLEALCLTWPHHVLQGVLHFLGIWALGEMIGVPPSIPYFKLMHVRFKARPWFSVSMDRTPWGSLHTVGWGRKSRWLGEKSKSDRSAAQLSCLLTLSG